MEVRNCDTTKNPDRIPVAMTIAGSDSGGGAGIQADLRTFSALGVFGSSAITAVTSQNPCAVSRVDALPPDAVAEQIRTVLDVIDVRAVKTGMLHSAEIIRTVANCLKQTQLPLVIDPVMISTSGSKLLLDDALECMMTNLLPLATWITPNIPEAELLSGMKIRSSDDVAVAAEKIATRWNTGVILKGGHAEGDRMAADIVCSGGLLCSLATPRLSLPPYASHGTGCTLSAAITAFLAKGESPLQAIVSAKAFVLGSLAEARMIGKDQPVAAMVPPAELEKYKKQIMISRL